MGPFATAQQRKCNIRSFYCNKSQLMSICLIRADSLQIASMVLIFNPFLTQLQTPTQGCNCHCNGKQLHFRQNNHHSLQATTYMQIKLTPLFKHDHHLCYLNPLKHILFYLNIHTAISYYLCLIHKVSEDAHK